MAIKIESFKIVSTDGKITRSFSETTFATPQVIQVSASNWEVAQAVVFSAFGFEDNLTINLGYRVRPRNANRQLKTLKHSYVSPFPHAEVSLFWDTVEEEITLGRPEFTGLARFNRLIGVLELTDLLSRRPDQLSGGETAKVILASHLLNQPEVIVVDRVLGEVDVHTRSGLIDFIRSDCTDTLLAALDDAPLGDVNYYFDADQDNVSATFAPPATAKFHHSLFDYRNFELSFGSEGDRFSKEYLLIENLGVERAGRMLFDGLSLKASSGSFIWVLGPNGSGKTTFFEVLLNFITPSSGGVSLVDGSSQKKVVDNIAYSPQDPEADITELTLFKEIELTRPKRTAADVTSWLVEIGVDQNLIHVPLIEDVALRKLASVLAAVSRNKKICLLDEPTLFLSDLHRTWVINAMRGLLNAGGIIFCATHDNTFFNLFSHGSTKNSG
jgi:ABC-type multidrug transport system ATPase subunit